MTATLTATNVVHNLFFVHENDVREFVKAYDNRESATSRGRTAVRKLDALSYIVESVDPDAAPQIIDDELDHLIGEVSTDIDLTITTHLDMADEMTGCGAWIINEEPVAPAPARKFSRKVRVFLKDTDVDFFSYDADGKTHEVRVFTVKRSDTATEVLGHADRVSIFGNKAGLIDEVALHDAPANVHAALQELGLY